MLRKLRRVSFGDIPHVARGYRHLLTAGIRLFVLRQPIETWLAPRHDEQPSARDMPDASERVKRAARWSNTCARYPFPWARCLQRSLAMCYWLEKEGIQPALKIGVRKQGAAFDAHAWVEYGGQVVNDNQAVKSTFIAFSPGAAGVFDTRRLKFNRS